MRLQNTTVEQPPPPYRLGRLAQPPESSLGACSQRVELSIPTLGILASFSVISTPEFNKLINMMSEGYFAGDSEDGEQELSWGLS